MPVYFAVSLAARTLVAPLHRVAACCSQVYASSSRSETLLCDHSVRVRSAGVPSGNRAVLVCAEAPHSSSTSMVDAGQKKRKMQEVCFPEIAKRKEAGASVRMHAFGPHIFPIIAITLQLAGSHSYTITAVHCVLLHGRLLYQKRPSDLYYMNQVAIAVPPVQMAASDMIDLADFASINKDMTEYDEKREKVIKDSRGAPPSWHPVQHVADITTSSHCMTNTRAAQISKSSLNRPSTACIEGTWRAQQRSWPRQRLELRSCGPSWMWRAPCARVAPSPRP